MIRLTVEPEDDQHWWWLPEFLADEPDNANHWSIQFCSSSNPVGRVGVFVGPLKAPIYENEK